jgi:beta-lactamase superfamily II metal-dependent hydrolase
MYNVGFGDAFVVTVRDGKEQWRMLVECGVHAHGQARPLEATVAAIVADLEADSADGVARLDVVAATHHHADHIAGFQFEDWSAVEVGEVWVPFVEDPEDDDAKVLRKAHRDAARRLTALIDDRVRGLAPGAWPLELTVASWFAANSSGNDTATDRLLGRNGLGFATMPAIRYLPRTEAAENTIELPVAGALVHVLGPPRDPDLVKRMNPPASAGWLTLDADLLPSTDASRSMPLFDPYRYVIDRGEVEARYPQLVNGHQALTHLDRLNDDGILAAASVLERSVNNTSLFFVLEVGGVRLLFPGDSQQGAWDHVLGDPAARELVADVAFLKISHHGSHNGTPKGYVNEVLHEGADAMLPWGLVKRWESTIPKRELLDGLEARHHRIIRADKPKARRGKVTVSGDLWSEIRFPVPMP